MCELRSLCSQSAKIPDVRLTCRTIPERSMLDDRPSLPGPRRRHSPAGPSGGSYVRTACRQFAISRHSALIQPQLR